jgi:hypothetical protein
MRNGSKIIKKYEIHVVSLQNPQFNDGIFPKRQEEISKKKQPRFGSHFGHFHPC